MEYYGKKPLSTFIDEEKKAIQSPSHLYHHYSPSRSNSTPNCTMYSLMPPPSPDSPWTFSPIQTPSPSLLYNCITSLHRQDDTIYSIAASNGVVFTCSGSNRIRAWRQPDCVESGSLKASSGDVRAIISHGNLLFTSHKDHRVRIWNLTISENFRAQKVTTLPKRSSFVIKFSRKTTTTTTQHKDIISCMAYYHAEGILYTGSWDKTVKAWRVSNSKCVDSFQAHEDHVNAIMVNQIDGHVFTCSSDGSVKIWRRVYKQSSHTLTMTLKFQISPVNALAVSASSPTSCFLYSGSSDGLINFWEKEKLSGRFNHGGFLQGHRFSVLCLVAIEKLIFSGSEDTTIRVWRREKESCLHECLAVLDAHRGPVKCLAASLEREKVVTGFLVYSAGLDQSFKVWRVKVMPDENIRVCLDGTDSSLKMNINNNNMEYEMSPVLSPSWVEKKIQGDHKPFY